MDETNVYKDWTTVNAGREELPTISQKISICSGIHRSEYIMRENSTYDEGVHTLQ